LVAVAVLEAVLVAVLLLVPVVELSTA
jgi:hypothetical protein